MRWYLGVIGRLHHEENLIYILKREVTNGTPNIFKEIHNDILFQHLRYHLFPIIINTTSDGVHFLNQIKREVPRSGKVDSYTMNKHDFFINVPLIIQSYCFVT